MSEIRNWDMHSSLFEHLAFLDSEMSEIENTHPKCGKSEQLVFLIAKYRTYIFGFKNVEFLILNLFLDDFQSNEIC